VAAAKMTEKSEDIMTRKENASVKYNKVKEEKKAESSGIFMEMQDKKSKFQKN
jgi:hypothetical protein